MSVTSRKVGFYSIAVKKLDGSLADQKKILTKVISYILSLPKPERKFEIPSSKRFHILDIESIDGDKHYLTFKSAKYYHRPPLIDKDTLAERDNPKKLEEGESEKTHIGLRYLSSEAICVMEERKAGISINNFVIYLERFIKIMAENGSLRNQYQLVFSLIPEKNFLEELKKITQVKIGDIYVTKQLLGSGHLNFSNRLSETQECFVISVKAQRKRSIKATLIDIYHKLVSSDEVIKKIRIHGQNENKNKVTIDTEVLKKIQYVNSTLNAITGVVDSTDFFKEITPLLDSFED